MMLSQSNDSDKMLPSTPPPEDGKASNPSKAQEYGALHDSTANRDAVPHDPNVEGCRYIVDTIIPKLYANGKLELIEPVRNPGLDTIVASTRYNVCLKANPIDDHSRRVDMLQPRLTAFLHRLAEMGIGKKKVFASIEWEFDKHPWLPAHLREQLEREEAEYPALKAEMEALIETCRAEMMEDSIEKQKK
jgi:hypothetical protein